MPTGIDTGCVHGTTWFVRNLGQALLDICDDNPATALTDIGAHAVEVVADRHGSSCDLDAPGTLAATLTMLRLGPRTCDYLVLSDSHLVVLRTDGSVRALTDQTLESLATIERARVYRHPIGSPAHRDETLRLVRKQIALRNRPGGYWLVASDPVAGQHALSGSVDSSEVRAALLMTDGAARPVDLYGLLTWPDLFELLSAVKPSEYLSLVHRIDHLDPRGEVWPRYETTDDAAIALYRREPHTGGHGGSEDWVAEVTTRAEQRLGLHLTGAQ